MPFCEYFRKHLGNENFYLQIKNPPFDKNKTPLLAN